ncbi:ATP-grasp domain-containing protein [Methylomonas sp. SURF-2]|uniref:ATP-grasp domain-containing protein n=1 Tax=Methylomonas subterranea TaxID=2952225 RepID=A0ABT1TKE7_9GAMM|nr:ATP-grasp domain-containing protein [Methylomonas sp. SURF-2]MCQ8105691.1 ATP-grasp domain-containing protein [Methylomonas sp. SURF-2]
MSIPLRLLVIGRSARMLAQLAVDAGFQVVAIDCYADLDTCRLATETVRVADLAVADIAEAVEALTQKHGLTHAVYGSGFEAHVDSLRYLESRLIVLGNPPTLFMRFQDKPAFFRHLQQLAIPYPDTVFSPPAADQAWLVKPMRGEGGFAISRHCLEQTVDAGRFYWQRYLNGQAMSVLFVADHGKIKLFGFNRQWIAEGHEQPFTFAGIANHAHVSSQNRALLVEWLDGLGKVYPLRGLGSLDFIVKDGQCYMLELNARIPASAQLYGKSVFTAHCLACLGRTVEIGSSEPAGFHTVFARNDLLISSGVSWPEWVVDRPADGAFVGKGRPVCSIIAGGNDAQQVEDRLRRRQLIIENFLYTGHLTHAIPS